MPEYPLMTSVERAVNLDNAQVFFDFDNTLTVGDTLDQIIRRFSVNENWFSLEKAWANGEISTKACLEGQLKDIRVTRKQLNKYLAQVPLDPYCRKIFSYLQSEGIAPVILSDNFLPVIEEILKIQGIGGVKVFANDLVFVKDRIVPSFPYFNPLCPNCAHCKKIHLQEESCRQKLLIYVGDGRSDFCPAAASDIVFAKDKLAQHLRKSHQEHIEYKDLGDILRCFKNSEAFLNTELLQH